MDREPPEGLRMSSMTAPVNTPAFAPARGRRKVKNTIATVLVTLAFGVALVPLVWLLYVVITKGAHAIVRSGWWDKDQAGVSSTVRGGGVFASLVGTAEQVLICTVI